MDDLTTRLENCYTGAVHDVMRERGHVDFVLPREITPLLSDRKLAGPVYTVNGHMQPSADGHETLLAWTGLLGRAPAGSVVICQPNNHSIALMGELSAETLQIRGVRGYIVDGGCRDTDFILEMGFPVFSRFSTPLDILGAWLPDTFAEPIKVGDVQVSAGDYVLGDRDGIVILPADQANDIVNATETVMATENLVRKAILEGADPQDAYRRYGKF